MNFTSAIKLINHPTALMQWAENGDTRCPVTIKIDLTNVCNHNCPGCIDYELIENDNNRLPYDTLDHLLRELKTLGVRGINYTGGGEPTLHPQFSDIAERTKSLGLDVGLITNGSYFHKLDVERILPFFDWIRISLDAFDSESYRITHGFKANFEQVMENIRILTSVKKTGNISTILGSAYLTHQFPKLDEVLERFIVLSRDAGLDYAQLRPSFGTFYDYKSDVVIGRLEEFKNYSAPNFKVYCSDAKYRKIRLGQETKRNYKKCFAQFFKGTTVTASGDVYVCCSLTGRPEAHIGNVRTSSFSEIWSGTNRRKQLDQLDVSQCPALCIGDEMNELMHAATTVPNPSFL